MLRPPSLHSNGPLLPHARVIADTPLSFLHESEMSSIRINEIHGGDNRFNEATMKMIVGLMKIGVN